MELDDLFPEERSKGHADADAEWAAGTVRVFREVWFWHSSTYAKAYVARIKELCAQHSSHRQEGHDGAGRPV